ncbi:MAG: response regulator [Alphaproteobacteria bacterium]|nr:MAG: response regulator [Alphaproteobacteria bacterium]
MKIFMIADDSPVIRKVGRRIIEDLGFVVVEAANGEEALALARDNMPDAIMVDWDMPRMSGIELVRELAALPGADKARIIYCTSSLMVPEMTKAKRAGAAGFMMKPFNRKLLTEILTELGLMETASEAAA